MFGSGSSGQLCKRIGPPPATPSGLDDIQCLFGLPQPVGESWPQQKTVGQSTILIYKYANASPLLSPRCLGVGSSLAAFDVPKGPRRNPCGKAKVHEDRGMNKDIDVPELQPLPVVHQRPQHGCAKHIWFRPEGWPLWFGFVSCSKKCDFFSKSDLASDTID